MMNANFQPEPVRPVLTSMLLDASFLCATFMAFLFLFFLLLKALYPSLALGVLFAPLFVGDFVCLLIMIAGFLSPVFYVKSLIRLQVG